MANCFENLHSRFQCLCPCCNLPGLKWCLVVFFSILAIATAATVVIIRFAVIPKVKATVDDARLDTFQFSPSQGGRTSFNYNISVALAIRNSNIAMRIRCTKPLVATFIFHDLRLANVTVAGTGKKYRRSKTELHIVKATGEVPPLLLGAATEDFKKQNATGLFMVEMRLSGEITYQRVIYIPSSKRTLSMSCLLRLQLAPPGSEIVVFHKVNCKPIEQDKIYF